MVSRCHKDMRWKDQHTLLVLLNVEATEQHDGLSSVDATKDLVGRLNARTVSSSV